MPTGWNPFDAAAVGATLSNGGLTLTTVSSGGTWCTARVTTQISGSAKAYIEFYLNNLGSMGYTYFGFADAVLSGNSVYGTLLGSRNYSVGMRPPNPNQVSGFTSNYTVTGNTSATGDVWGLAIDYSAGKIWIARNGVWLNGSNPETGSLPIVSFNPATVGPLFAAIGFYYNTDIYIIQATSASQKYLAPSGFSPWDSVAAAPGWSVSDAVAGGVVLSNGGQTATWPSGGTTHTMRNTTSHSDGKLYVEFFLNAIPTTQSEWFGVADINFNPVYYLGQSGVSAGIFNAQNYVGTGFTSKLVTSINTASGDVWALAIDFTGKIWIAQNNVWSNSGNPATGTFPVITFVPATVGALFAGVSTYFQDVITLQATAASQKYAPPAGFSAWDGGAKKAGSAALMIGV